MGKLLYFPDRKISFPSRPQLVEKAAGLLMKEVASIYAEKQIKQTNLAVWFREIRDYLWRQEINLSEDMDFYEIDLRRWKMFWKNQALKDIESKTIQ